MKHFLLLILIGLLPFSGKAQKADSTKGKFGLALNTGISTMVLPVRLIPTFSYYHGNHKLELGIGFHPFIMQSHQVVSGEFNYKYFPNGLDKKFNMYLMASFRYLNHLKKSYYPTRYNYLFLNAGYGFQVKVAGRVYLGTNLAFGAYTNSRQSENPYNYDGSAQLFKSFGMNFEFQANIGYRF